MIEVQVDANYVYVIKRYVDRKLGALSHGDVRHLRTDGDELTRQNNSKQRSEAILLGNRKGNEMVI